MAEFTSYPPGTPSWVDVSSPDLPASRAFYGGLFGWAALEGGPEAGGYTMFQKKGKNVAGMGPIMMEGQPSAWTTYVTVDDADATTAKVTAAGGTVLVAPMDVLDVGRMAIYLDPTGAAIAVWQPKAHTGAGLANEAGTFTWNELQTRDTDAAKAFYGAVFGWGAHSTTEGSVPYTEWKRGDDTVGGMMDMPGEIPAEVPANWLVYFAVDDCDATVEKAAKLGGSALMAPMDVDPGRMAVLSDPTGAAFAVIQMKGQ
jgi:uncharacterized protein